MNIKPTIGRRVWYWPSSFDKGRLASKPDTIMQVGDSTQACVNAARDKLWELEGYFLAQKMSTSGKYLLPTPKK